MTFGRYEAYLKQFLSNMYSNKVKVYYNMSATSMENKIG
jgi:hypothetical protein